jgi:hypothetical protein
VPLGGDTRKREPLALRVELGGNLIEYLPYHELVLVWRVLGDILPVQADDVPLDGMDGAHVLVGDEPLDCSRHPADHEVVVEQRQQPLVHGLENGFAILEAA